jgi:hypothetical protein
MGSGARATSCECVTDAKFGLDSGALWAIAANYFRSCSYYTGSGAYLCALYAGDDEVNL